ncbi:MAG: triose-phosphate isomerase, partial [Pseudomonadota bacterium]
GRTATPAQAEEAHQFIRGRLQQKWGDLSMEIRIQYGGSVKPSNAAELLAQPNIDGALVGGASLKAETLVPIVLGVSPVK